MSSEKKFKTFRVKMHIHPTECITERSHKHVIKVAKRIIKPKTIDKSLENDLVLEKGDPKDFLKDSKDTIEKLGYRKYEGLSRKSSLFSSKRHETNPEPVSPVLTANELRSEALRKKLASRYAFAQHLIDKNLKLVDKEKQINLQIQEIEKRIASNQIDQHKKLSRLTLIEKIAFLKEEKSLHCYTSAEAKWQKIESGLVRKSSKHIQELITKKNQSLGDIEAFKTATWSMSLRNSGTEKVEVFLPVGNKLSGLFLRDIVSLDGPRHVKSKSLPELKVVGCSKLPLEIDAFKRGVGLNKRIEKEEKFEDEIYVENYSFPHRYLKKFDD